MLKISYLLRLIVSIILVQTLYFKFGAHPEAVHIFTTLGVEPWGRILLGCVELIVGVTLLIPKTQLAATFAAIGLMMGALGAHLLTPLGIIVVWDNNSDGGALFAMAMASLLLCIFHLFAYRKHTKRSFKTMVQVEIFGLKK